MNNHICVFLAFRNVNDIKMSFDSMYHDEMDFIILENHSDNSDEICEYFKDKKLRGYIKYEDNAALCAFNIFIRDHREILLEYDYITITDGDLYFYDIREAFNEIRDGLDKEDCIIASASLYNGNNYSNKNRIIGVDSYNDIMRDRTVEFGCHEGKTQCNVMTLKKENLSLIEDMYFGDTHVFRKVQSWGKKWYRTSRCLAYHLTWDLYVEGNEYYEWKMKVLATIWKITGEFEYAYIVDPTKRS